MNVARDSIRMEKKLEGTLALTPALSPRRGSKKSPFRVLWSCSIKSAAGIASRLDSFLPLPGGEGWGEGKRSIQATENARELKQKQFLKHELWLFGVLILLLNLPLMNGTWNSVFAFHPELVRDGEWWRVLTFPFVHVSVYHLLLDAAAFFILYSSLREPSRFNRLGIVVASALGSLLVSIFAAPHIYSVGLCGLSGVAHGLMAVSALEMMQTKKYKRIFWAGAISFLFVTGKAAWEAITGQVVFSHLHFGNLGTPIAVCHAGGTLGVLFIELVRKKVSR